MGRLTKRHEASQPHPWGMGDSPQAFINEMLAAIVGLEIGITRLVGKSKLSQNKERRDVLGAAHALESRGHNAIAGAMLARLAERSETPPRSGFSERVRVLDRARAPFVDMSQGQES